MKKDLNVEHRINKIIKQDKIFLNIAKEISKMSNCVKYQVGCLIAKNSRIISTGFNGTPSKFINCDQYFDKKNYDGDEHREWSKKFEIHAEMNAIMFAAKEGIETEGSVMYITMQPCHNCLKHIKQAGIVTVIYEEEHDSNDYDKETWKMVKDTNLVLLRFEPNDKTSAYCRSGQRQVLLG